MLLPQGSYSHKVSALRLHCCLPLVRGRHNFPQQNTVSAPPGSRVMRITINEHSKVTELFCFINLTLLRGGKVCNIGGEIINWLLQRTPLTITERNILFFVREKKFFSILGQSMSHFLNNTMVTIWIMLLLTRLIYFSKTKYYSEQRQVMLSKYVIIYKFWFP